MNDFVEFIYEIDSSKMNAKSFKIKILDEETLIKNNNLKEITNPVFFEKSNVPTIDGLLSNEIFGIVKADRANIFAYIDLTDYFLHPLVYKIWSRMDSNLRHIVHGTKTFSINSKGQFVEDENGKTGLKFLKDNIDKIKIQSTDSSKRDRNIKFINENRDRLFLRKWIVIPAFYRDVNTSDSHKGVGEINKFYSSLLMGAKSARESKDYGFDVSDMIKGRIQETLLVIYDWMSKEPNIYGKKGILRRAVMSKTSDYGARLVISAPDLKVEKLEDLYVDLDHSALPLHAACVNFFPFVVFNVRRFFENEFMGRLTTEVYNKNRQKEEVELNEPLIYFSDERIKMELDRFIKGFSNRFIPIQIPIIKDGKESFGRMRFRGRLYKGKFINDENIEDTQSVLIERDLTWCDVFYRAAVEATKDKHIMITRYPIDKRYNIFPSKVVVSSTTKTEAVIINDTVYERYPYIRQEDIGSNTSDKFVDTLQMSNLHLGSIGGDYDGDQCQTRGVFTVEANKECEEFLKSKGHYIDLTGVNVRLMDKETAQCFYALTKVNYNDKLIDPQF